MTSEQTSRRNLLKGAGLAGVACLLPGISFADGRKGKASRKRVLRFAHFTDSHVNQHGADAKWLAKALEHANGLDDAPSMIMFGGDMIFEGSKVDATQMRNQWSQFHGVMRNSNNLPVQYCLGNHDIWGWNSRTVNPNEPLYGKRWALDTLQMDHAYYSFDKAGWHFVVLDSVAKCPSGYVGRLGTDQVEWLARDLAAHADKPTLVMSHIPLLSASSAFFGNSEYNGNWHIPGSLMHIDARHVKDIFHQHGSVKVAISGHLHLVDRVDYNSVSYLCNGSICGNWWKGPFQETPPGYTVMDLYDDGTWHREYMKYGWQPAAV